MADEISLYPLGELPTPSTLSSDQQKDVRDLVYAMLRNLDGTVTYGTVSEVFRLSERGIQLGSSDFDVAPFSVTMAGLLRATGAVISGDITATTGTFGGFTIGADYLRDAADSFGLASTVTVGDDVRFWAGSTFAARATAPARIYESGSAVFKDVEVSGIIRTSVFERDVISAVGGQLLIANADVLDVAMTALDASTLKIKGETTFAVNDILHVKDGTDEEYMRVTNIGSAPTYTVTRDLAGAYTADNNPAWAAGTAVVVEGSSDGAATFSGGYLRLIGSGANSPRYGVFKRTGVGYNAVTEYAGFGNLNGLIDYVNDEYGVAIGDSSRYMTYDPTNGLRIKGAASVNGSALGFEDIYGDGSDGDVVISSDTTLTRDMFYDNLTIEAGFTLNPGGFRVHVRDTLTVAGSLSRNGVAGSAGTAASVSTPGSGGAGGTALADGSVKGTTASAAGGAGGSGSVGATTFSGANGTAGSSASNVAKSATQKAGAAGGAGGLGGRAENGSSGVQACTATPGAAGTGGAVTGTVFNLPRTAFAAWLLQDFFPSVDALKSSAPSAGGGGGTSGAVDGSGGSSGDSGGGGGGGGGGSPGGIVPIYAKTIVVDVGGSIKSEGGAGGNGGNGGNASYSAGSAGYGGGAGGGGGGGGAGGLLVLVYGSLTNNGTISVAGGVGGTKGSGGTGNGAAGGVANGVTPGFNQGEAGADGSNGATGNDGVIVQLRI